MEWTWSGTRGNISSLNHTKVVVVNMTQTASSTDIAQVCLRGPFNEESLWMCFSQGPRVLVVPNLEWTRGSSSESHSTQSLLTFWMIFLAENELKKAVGNWRHSTPCYSKQRGAVMWHGAVTCTYNTQQDPQMMEWWRVRLQPNALNNYN